MLKGFTQYYQESKYHILTSCKYGHCMGTLSREVILLVSFGFPFQTQLIKEKN